MRRVRTLDDDFSGMHPACRGAPVPAIVEIEKWLLRRFRPKVGQAHPADSTEVEQ
jgi:hypothetical protein